MKKAKKDNVKKEKSAKKTYNISGLLMVFVVVSIAYSTYIVALGTDGYVPKIMLIPQALFAAWIFVTKFIK